MLIGGIDAGGTSINCAVTNYSDKKPDIIQRTNIETSTPDESLPQILEFFKPYKIDALGISCFGPIDLDCDSSTYGFITTTPKPGWRNCDFVGYLRNEIDAPIGFDTDVNGAALAEIKWGIAKGLKSCLYLTVGTGIGGGAVVEGNLIHGLLHPEMGHILVRRHNNDDFEGTCPNHGDCLEGLASGLAIEKRTGIKGQNIKDENDIAWEIVSSYLAQAVVSYTLILSPQKIILGGGVMKHNHLFPLIRSEVKKILNSYLLKDELLDGINNYIVYPDLGADAGLFGGFALGIDALGQVRKS